MPHTWPRNRLPAAFTLTKDLDVQLPGNRLSVRNLEDSLDPCRRVLAHRFDGSAFSEDDTGRELDPRPKNGNLDKPRHPGTVSQLICSADQEASVLALSWPVLAGLDVGLVSIGTDRIPRADESPGPSVSEVVLPQLMCRQFDEEPLAMPNVERTGRRREDARRGPGDLPLALR